ncbi:DUF7017 domain-containing protein [Desulfonatronum parangueonense]
MIYPNQEISSLRKGGRIDEAYKRGQDLLREHPNDKYLKNIFGWVLYDKIKLIANRENQSKAGSASGEVRALLREYARLDLPRPDLLFSLLLNQSLRIRDKLDFFPAFMSWAGLGCFRPEDLQAQEGKKGDALYEPLIEKAARVTAKSVRGGKDDSLKSFAIELLDKAISEGEVQGLSWLHYNKALLLRELGRTDDARTLLHPFVREKRTNFWSWHALSKIEEQENPLLALALCARACLTCNDAKFGVKVFEDLARFSVAVNRFDLARWSTTRAVSIRQENGWGIPDSLRNLTEADWYSSAPAIDDAAGELESYAYIADSIVYSDCPRVPANFLGTFNSKTGKLMAKVALRKEALSVEMASPSKGLTNAKIFSIGEPVTVGIFEEEQRSTIIEIKPRTEGEFFDCLDSFYGVVDHMNHEKSLASIYVTDTKFCLLPFQDFDAVSAWQPGTPVSIWCTHSDDRLRPYRAEITGFQESEWISLVSGEISLHPGGFAFVKDVFVPPHLAKLFEDGREVSMVVVRKKNKKTNLLGWTAISLAYWEGHEM